MTTIARKGALTGPNVNGKALKRVRELLGISLTEMAARTEATDSHICNIEAGRRGVSWSLYRRMCDELDSDLDTFLRSGTPADAESS